MSGFAILHREAREHPLFAGDASRFGAWSWLILSACWKPTPFDIRGKVVTLDRGQLCVSVRQLAEAWGWSKSAVDRFLSRLETETMIKREAGHGRMVLTICNYSKYQDLDESDRDTTGTATGTQSPHASDPNATRSQPDQKPGHREDPSNPQNSAIPDDLFERDRDRSGTAAGQQRDIKEQGNKGTREEETDVSSLDAPARRAPKRAVKLPTDWEPVLTPAAQRIVDGWPPGKLDAELQRFRDHAADKGRVSKDWQAAFRTWLTKADEWMIRDGRSGQPRGPQPRSGDGSVDYLLNRIQAGGPR